MSCANKKKSPKDINKLAAHIVQESTKEAIPEQAKPTKSDS